MHVHLYCCALSYKSLSSHVYQRSITYLTYPLINGRQRTSEDDDRLKEDKHSTSAHKKAKKMKKKRSDQSPSKSTPKKETTIAKKSKHSTDTEKPRPKEVRSQEGAPVAEPTSGAVKTYYPKIVFDHLQLARNLADRDRGRG